MKIRFFTLLTGLLLSSFVGAQTIDTNTLTNGLVARWMLNGSGAETIGNSSAIANNVQWVKSNIYGSERQVAYLGSGGTLFVPKTPALNLHGTGFALIGWVKSPDFSIVPGPNTFFTLIDSQGQSGVIDSAYRLRYNSSSLNWQFKMNNSYVDSTAVNIKFFKTGEWGNDLMYNNTWNFIVLSYDGRVFRAFVNGVELKSSAPNFVLESGSSYDSDRSTGIGVTSDGDTGGYDPPQNGYVSDVRIYNRALSSNEVSALYAMESTPPAPPTTTDTFGTGTNQFGIDFVTVGNPGNSNDTTGYGGVPYSYRIGKYTISQNQIDAATRNGLQNVTAGAWSGDQPAANISWYEAAAYVNWLNTSQGYRPAYNLTYTNGAWSMALWPASPDTNGNVAWTLGGTNLFRNALCHYFLPSENEWYKAAYYDPNKNGGSGGYWLYPTGSDSAPTPVASGSAAGTAVYNQPWGNDPASVFQAGGISPYGTMGQGGNVWQWEETGESGNNNNVLGNRVCLGGAWGDGADLIHYITRYVTPPVYEDFGHGFRVASVDDSWLTNGLVAHWPLKEDFLDRSTNRNNLIINGAVLESDLRFISAMHINPTASLVSEKNIGIYGNNERTISFWMKQNNTGGDILFWGSKATNGIPYQASEIRTDITGFYCDWSWAASGFICPISIGQWRHITYVYSDHVGNDNLYIDGSLCSKTDLQYPPIQVDTIDSQVVIGKYDNINNAIDAYYHNIRIYNRALSSNEVAQLYALESTPPPVIAPTIATQPIDQSISLGQNTSFTIEPTGSGPFSYQWMKDGVALTNQTNASLVITNAQSNAVGYYSCTVTDANSNSVTSSNGALNISGVPFWLWQGLVAYYPFNGNLKDSGLYHFDGISLSNSFGHNRFISDNASLQITASSLVSLPINFQSTKSLSISTWVQLNKSQSFYLIYNDDLNRSGFGLSYHKSMFQGNETYPCGWNFFAGDGSNWRSGANTNITETNLWNHFVSTIDSGGNVLEYINGELISYNNINIRFNISSNALTRIGLFGLSPTPSEVTSSICNISDVRFFSRVLSSNEVASLYALESTPPGPTNSQLISFPTLPTLTLTNGAYSLGATASSELPVSYAIGDSNLAGITNGTLIPLGVGTTTVVASQSGDTNYLPATPVTNTLVVTLAQQTVIPSSVATRIYGSLPFGLTLPTNASGLPITTRIVSGPATLSGTNIILTGTGTVTLAYEAPGNDLYDAASVTNSFAVTNGPTNLKSQTITFKALAAKAYGSAPLKLVGSASSKLPLTFWSSNTNVAVINGTNAVITGAGSTVITAYQPGDGSTFNPATPVSQTLLVNQSSQKLTLKAPKSVAYGSTPAAITATSSVGLPVTLTSSDATIATITNSGTNSLLVPTGVGTITLTATQVGNTNVGAAIPVGQAVVISPGKQTITFAALGTNTYGASPMTLTATSSAGLPVSFTSSATKVATISGDTLTIMGAGSAKIAASQAGSRLWAPAKAATQSLTVAKASQTISFSIPTTVTYSKGGLVTLGATATSGLPVAYKSGNSKVLSITGSTCVITGKGTTTVVASQPGGANYLPASAITNTITVQ
jgi:hypothetical protein